MKSMSTLYFFITSSAEKLVQQRPTGANKETNTMDRHPTIQSSCPLHSATRIEIISLFLVTANEAK